MKLRILKSLLRPSAFATSSAGPDDEDPRAALNRLTLRFHDPELERGYRADYFRHHLATIRVAHLLGVAMWMLWGLALSRDLLFDRDFDVLMRYSVFIPILLAGFGLTFLRSYERFWDKAVAATLLASMAAWVVYVAKVRTMPPDYGYVGLILITAFGYTLVRLRFVIVVGLAIVPMAVYLPVGTIFGEIAGLKFTLAVIYLVSFGVLGSAAAYRAEWYTRLLFLRERQLDRERGRSENLLLNVLPRAIADRLKARHEERSGDHLAEHLDEVTVLFADAVGFTELSSKCEPDELVASLDELFGRFDAVADRFGLEKIKTVGDAYMAVAGAPTPRDDHATAAADMALAILDEAKTVRWPTGEPIRVRVGLASGPAVAGVIGRRKFAYDLWGDTVNLASRLEANGVPDRILVSKGVVERIRDRYRLSAPEILHLKGKGPTPAWFLLGRAGSRPRGRTPDLASEGESASVPG